MQLSEEVKVEQQAPSAGSASGVSGGQESTPAVESAVGITAAKKASKKKASKKKASKKKASKKKASKKKASKKKASKKKASKKKASKKKASKKRGKKKRGKKKVATSDRYTRVLAAADELRDALSELASTELHDRRQAVEDLRAAARAKISDLESAAQSSLAKLTGRG